MTRIHYILAALWVLLVLLAFAFVISQVVGTVTS